MGIVMAAFSLSTVAGVPLSLWLASLGGWHVPFVAIALVSVAVWILVVRAVPVLNQHLAAPTRRSMWQELRPVLADRSHWHAFALSCLVVLGSFSIIPYITIYTTTNVGLRADQVPLIYLAGGVATLFTARLWGWMSDRWGKVATFRLVSALAAVPMMALTLLPPVPLWMVLVVTTAFFVFVSGRMVPGMALLTAAPQASMRGAFMSANGALQSVTMGVSAWLGGSLISRSPQGLVQGYERCGWLAAVTTLVLLWWVGQVRVHGGGASAQANQNQARA